MNNTAKLTLSVLAIAGFLTASNAIAGRYQEDRSWHKGPPSVEKQLAHISSALELNDEQSAEMLAILQDAEKSREALHEETMAIMGKEICAQKAQTDDAILSVLDAEQAEAFLQMKAERAERAKGRRSGTRHGWGGPDCSDFTESE